MAIKDGNEIKNIVRDYIVTEEKASRVLGAMVSDFKIISFKLREELGARVYEVICEYRTFPPHPKDPRRCLVKVRAVTGKIIEHQEL